MTLANSVFAKASVAFVALATMFVLAAPALAQTSSDEMQSEIDRLTALIEQLTASLSGGSNGGATMSTSGVCPFTWTRTLNMGATGPDVMKLQQFLNSSDDTRVSASGAGSVGAETQYYGPLTGAAVAKFQTKFRAEILAPLGLVNATTFFGPSTMAQANRLCVSTPVVVPPVDDDMDDDVVEDDDDTPTANRDLQGGAGSIDDVELLSDYNNEDVGEGQDDVAVLGLDIEADRGSDIMIVALDLDFDQNSAASDLDDYIESVSVWFEGDMIAEFDVDEFDEDDDWDNTISLPRSVAPIIRRGDTNELVIAVTGIRNLDTGDNGDTWDLTVQEIRFRDADNAVITDDTTGDLPATRTFTVEDFASAADVDLSFTEEDEDINDARVLDIDDNDDQDGLDLMSINVELEGSSDVTIDEFPVSFTTVGADVDDLVSTVYLYVDGQKVGSENVPTSATTTTTIVFDDLDWVLDAETESEIVIKADFNPTSDANVTNGDTIQVDFGNNQRNQMDVEDENGDNLSASDMSGTVTGGAHAIYDSGIMVDFVSVSDSKTFTADEAGEADKVQFTFVFDVTAFDADAYLDKTVVATATPSASTDGQAFASTSQASGTSTVSSKSISASNTDTNDTSFAFIIDEDETRRFTLKVTLEAGEDGEMQIEVTGINWGTDGSGASTADQLYNFNLDDFLSDIVAVNVQ